MATAEALVTAGEQLLDGRDPEAVSVEEILERAGASPSSFYQRFGSKLAFFDHLHARLCDAVAAQAARFTDPARWEGRALEDAAPEAIAAYLSFRREISGALRSFEILEDRHPALRSRRREVDLALARGALERLHELRTRDGRAPIPERARLALDLAVSTLRSATDSPRRVRVAPYEDDARLAQDLATSLIAYLVGG